jgi:glycosyltransferase involved in cell wall biosynthesis
MTASVSVIIPAHRCAAYLDEAVASALQQGGMIREVWIGDDASDDATLERAMDWTRRDARVKAWSSPKNIGPSAVRNALLSRAGGDWIALLDGDDAMVPGRLERLSPFFCAADIVSDVLGDWDGTAIRRRRLSIVADQVTQISPRDALAFNLGWAKPLFRAAFLKQHALRFNERHRHSEDLDFYLRASLAGARWLHAPELGYLYRRHPLSLSRNWRIGLQQSRTVLRELLELPELSGRPDCRRLLTRMLRRKDDIEVLHACRERPFSLDRLASALVSATHLLMDRLGGSHA